jgi:hypothetical protein
MEIVALRPFFLDMYRYLFSVADFAKLTDCLPEMAGVYLPATGQVATNILHT